MHKKVILGTSLVFVILVVLVIYSRLGGLDEVTFEAIGRTEYVIYGRTFEGRYSDNKLEELFFETKEVLERDFPEQSLVVISYLHEDARDGQVKQFVGIPVDGAAANFPPSWERREVSFDKGVRAVITAHNLAMPKPEKVRAAVEEQAADQGWKLADYSLEIYQSERQMVVEFPAE